MAYYCVTIIYYWKHFTIKKMIASQNCINLIKMFEGYKEKAYLCPAGVPTIGYGSTMYSDGRKIKLGDTINEQKANDLLMWELINKSIALYNLDLNQNQFDSCLSFIYNLGIGSFTKSTLRKKVVANPNDPSIRLEFMKWNKATVDGKLIALKGLTRRRIAEADWGSQSEASARGCKPIRNTRCTSGDRYCPQGRSESRT